MGPECTKLTPGEEGQAALRYVNPAARWTQYKKLMIPPVTFWGGDQSKVSPEDQQTLVNYFYEVLNEELTKQFQIVDQPGPDVAMLQVAVTDVEAAKPGLRSISMVVPQARLNRPDRHGLERRSSCGWLAHAVGPGTAAPPSVRLPATWVVIAAQGQ